MLVENVIAIKEGMAINATVIMPILQMTSYVKLPIQRVIMSAANLALAFVVHVNATKERIQMKLLVENIANAGTLDATCMRESNVEVQTTVFANAINATVKEFGLVSIAGSEIAPLSKTGVSRMGLFVTDVDHVTAISASVIQGIKEHIVSRVRHVQDSAR